MNIEPIPSFRDTNSPAVMVFVDTDERQAFSSLAKAIRHVMREIPGGRRIRARIENGGSLMSIFEIAAVAGTMNLAWD